MKAKFSIALLTTILLLSGCATKAPQKNPALVNTNYSADDVLAIVSKKLENPKPTIYGRCGYVTSPDSDVLYNGNQQRGVCIFDKNSLVFIPIDTVPLPTAVSDYKLISTPYKNLKGVGLSDRLSPNTTYEASQVQMKKSNGAVIGVIFAKPDGKPGYDLEKPEAAVNFLWQKKVPKIPGGTVWSAQQRAGKVELAKGATEKGSVTRPSLSARGGATFEDFTGEGAACISSETSFPRLGDDVNTRIEYINNVKTSGAGAFWVGDHGKTGPYCVEPGSVDVWVFAVAGSKALNKTFTIDAKRGAKYMISARVNGDNFDFKIQEVLNSQKVVIKEESLSWGVFTDPDNIILIPVIMPNGTMFFL